MLLMRQLTENSWIFEQEDGDKIGIITHNPNDNMYVLISPTMKVDFKTIDELGGILESEIKEVKSNRTKHDEFIEVNGFPIFSKTHCNVREVNNHVVYNEVEGGIDWIAGYWVHCTAGVWKIRTSIKQSRLMDTENDVFGPFKSKMEAQFLATSKNKEDNI